MAERQKAVTSRRRVYEILELGRVGDTLTSTVDRALVALIVVNLVCVALESEPTIDIKYNGLFIAIEVFSSIVFTVEYFLRIWCCVEQAQFRGLAPWRARLKYMLSPPALIDLIAVLPFWFFFIAPGALRALLVLRIVRFLKLTRYSPGMRSLLDAVYEERRALFACLVILAGAALIAATMMYVAEGHVQPEKLGSIPRAMWWALVTLGTVGYGDVVPITPLGKLVGAGTILIGLLVMALPVGIVATAFAREIHRRDFVVTWGMVARVPLFAELNAVEIAEIMRLLRAQTVEAGTVIAHRGDPARSMYFVASGEVDIQLPDNQFRFGAGHFFGEIAVLRRARRSGTITALTRTSLLVLDGHDLHTLMEHQPDVARRINEVVKSRIGAEAVTPRGDIAVEELHEDTAAAGSGENGV